MLIIEQIKLYLEEIDIDLEKHYSKSSDISLMKGKSGYALFLFKYGEFLQSRKKIDKGTDIICSILDDYISSPCSSFSEGLAGVSWLIHYASDLGYIEFEKDFFSEIDKFLVCSYKNEVKRNNWDFLNGSLGILSSFLTRENVSDSTGELINIFTGSIINSKVKFNSQYPYLITQKDKDNINLGIPHGLLGVLKILLLIYKKGIEKDKVKTLIYLNIKIIKCCELEDNNFLSSFPPIYRINEKNIASRLGWCYGDLGICLILIQIAREFNDSDLFAYAMKIGLKTIKRKDLKENLVFDHCFYYGSPGVSYMYKKIYEITKEEIFREACHYWLDISMFQYSTLKSNFFDRYTGKYQSNYTMLEGLIGLSLTWLSFFKSESSWDECFLLS